MYKNYPVYAWHNFKPMGKNYSREFLVKKSIIDNDFKSFVELIKGMDLE
jgi:hypothetical protein